MTLKQAIKCAGNTPRTISSGNCKICRSIFYQVNILGAGYCKRRCADIGRRTGEFFSCKNCHQPTWRMQSEKTIVKLCSWKCRVEFKRGSNHQNWKGGHIDKKTGYRLGWKDGKTLQEHRVVMETYLGRKLKRTEHVHHIDHDRLNNSISNLQVLNSKEHFKLHINLRPKADVH